MEYEVALKRLLEIEGDPTNYAWDSGGRTAFGIAEAYWPQYWKNGTPTLDTARKFYKAEFWSPLRLGSINSGRLQFEMFEAGVNCGVGNAVRFAQEAYNLLKLDSWQPLDVDGRIGPKTLRALNQMTALYEDAMLAGCNFFQADYYVSLNPTLRGYALRGWFAKRLSWSNK